MNGSCDRGCKPGWKGDNCQQRNALTEHLFNWIVGSDNISVNNIWMVIWVKTCPTNKNVLCTSLIGFSACHSGFYGQDCTLACNDKCTECNNVDGNCNNECQPGWDGERCKQSNSFKLHKCCGQGI